jgi:predicted nucleic acid-binding protein
MNIIADTNIFLAVTLEEPEKEKIVNITSGCVLYAPRILHFEIGNALTAMVKRRRLTSLEAMEAWRKACKIPVFLLDISIEASLKIAFKYDRYAYDCYFLHLALTKNYHLLSLDRGMIHAAKELRINILEIKK